MTDERPSQPPAELAAALWAAYVALVGRAEGQTSWAS